MAPWDIGMRPRPPHARVAGAGLLALSLLSPARLVQAEPAVYLCVADRMAGFSFGRHARRWEPVLAQDTEKLLLNRSRRPGMTWEVKSLEGRYPFAWCAGDFDAAGLLQCEGAGGVIKINRGSGRFLRVMPAAGGASSPEDFGLGGRGRATPHLLAGACTGL
jgi:hypothetical protein